jgi:hypothetical protein
LFGDYRFCNDYKAESRNGKVPCQNELSWLVGRQILYCVDLHSDVDGTAKTTTKVERATGRNQKDPEAIIVRVVFYFILVAVDLLRGQGEGSEEK